MRGGRARRVIDVAAPESPAGYRKVAANPGGGREFEKCCEAGGSGVGDRAASAARRSGTQNDAAGCATGMRRTCSSDHSHRGTITTHVGSQLEKTQACVRGSLIFDLLDADPGMRVVAVALCVHLLWAHAASAQYHLLHTFAGPSVGHPGSLTQTADGDFLVTTVSRLTGGGDQGQSVRERDNAPRLQRAI